MPDEPAAQAPREVRPPPGDQRHGALEAGLGFSSRAAAPAPSRRSACGAGAAAGAFVREAPHVGPVLEPLVSGPGGDSGYGTLGGRGLGKPCAVRPCGHAAAPRTRTGRNQGRRLEHGPKPKNSYAQRLIFFFLNTQDQRLIFEFRLLGPEVRDRRNGRGQGRQCLSLLCSVTGRRAPTLVRSPLLAHRTLSPPSATHLPGLRSSSPPQARGTSSSAPALSPSPPLLSALLRLAARHPPPPRHALVPAAAQVVHTGIPNPKAASSCAACRAR